MYCFIPYLGVVGNALPLGFGAGGGDRARLRGRNPDSQGFFLSIFYLQWAENQAAGGRCGVIVPRGWLIVALQVLSHPNIVHYLGTERFRDQCTHQNVLRIFLEYVPGTLPNGI